MTRWLDDRESRAWRGLLSMMKHLDLELARRLSASGLSQADYAVLVALTDVEEGRIRAQDLAERLGWEKSRLSHQINRMAQRGLITRQDCPTDRRGTFLEVTADGRRTIELAAPDHVDAVRELLVDRLTTQQLDALAEIAVVVLGDQPCGTSITADCTAEPTSAS